MKKSLWIQMDFYRPNGNAPANRAYAFASFFNERGFETNVVTIGKNNTKENIEGTNVYRIKDKYHFKSKNIINRLLDNFCYYRGLKKLYRKHKAELKDSFFLLSVPEYIPSLVSKKLKKYGCTLIADLRDIWPEVAVEIGSFKQGSIMYRIFYKIAQKLYKTADLITVVTKKKFEYMQSINGGIYKNKIFYIGNGYDLLTKNIKINTEIFEKNNLIGKQVISYVGNIGKAQHLDCLLDYAVTKKDLFFVIGGMGSDLDRLINKYKGIDNIIFLGKVCKEDAVSITKLSFASFIPLASDNMLNSVPTKLFESLGLGIPVLLLANGESCEILDKCKLGLHIQPSESNNISLLFESLLANYDEIMANKDLSIKIIEEQYSRQKFCKELYDLLLLRL